MLFCVFEITLHCVPSPCSNRGLPLRTSVAAPPRSERREWPETKSVPPGSTGATGGRGLEARTPLQETWMRAGSSVCSPLGDWIQKKGRRKEGRSLTSRRKGKRTTPCFFLLVFLTKTIYSCNILVNPWFMCIWNPRVWKLILIWSKLSKFNKRGKTTIFKLQGQVYMYSS